MTAELRWILLTLGVVVLAGIWSWGARRARRVTANAALAQAPEIAKMAGAGPHERMHGSDGAENEDRYGIPPLEPLSIRTADFDEVGAMDLPMMSTVDPPDEILEMGRSGAPDVTEPTSAEAAPARSPERLVSEPPMPATVAPAAAAPAAAAAAPAASTAPAPAASTAPAPSFGTISAEPNISKAQHIVAVRVSAPAESPWPGVDLAATLEGYGLTFGRYKIFHAQVEDGRSLFSAANLAEPGTFDRDNMPTQTFRGITLFAVLPGPSDPLQTVEALLVTAGGLTETLGGSIQDAKGAPMSDEIAEAMRDDAAQFQKLLTTD